MKDIQIDKIRTYLSEIPTRINEILDTPEKKGHLDKMLNCIDRDCKPYFNAISEYLLPDGSPILNYVTSGLYSEYMPRYIQWADSYYDTSPLETATTVPEPSCNTEKTKAAYYVISKLNNAVTDQDQRIDLFGRELSYDTDPALDRMGFIKKDYPDGLIIKLNNALGLMKTDTEAITEKQGADGHLDDYGIIIGRLKNAANDFPGLICKLICGKTREEMELGLADYAKKYSSSDTLITSIVVPGQSDTISLYRAYVLVKKECYNWNAQAALDTLINLVPPRYIKFSDMMTSDFDFQCPFEIQYPLDIIAVAKYQEIKYGETKGKEYLYSTEQEKIEFELRDAFLHIALRYAKYLNESGVHTVGAEQREAVTQGVSDGVQDHVETENKEVNLTEDQVELLNWFNDNHPQICRISHYGKRSDKTNRKNANRLKELSFLEQPEGSGYGLVITEAGREYIENHF